jgi:hypothetical protein
MSWIDKKDRCCIDCGKTPVEERRRCKECAKEYNRQRARERHREKGRNYDKSVCPICQKEMILWRKNQLTHQSCRKKVVEDYGKVPRSKKGNTIGRQVVLDLGVEIPKNWVVHHLDENPENNTIENLLLMSRSDHNSLHRYLQQNWSLWLKGHSSNPENCWDILRDQLTTAWLETTNANVIKITGIGQSAAEPLSSNEYEEGSETMYGKPKVVKDQG